MTARRFVLALLLLTVVVALSGDTQAEPVDLDPHRPASVIGDWSEVFDLEVQAKHIVVLRGGVLFVSTGDEAGVWDPYGGTAPAAIPFFAGDLHCAAQATLGDGRAIVVGGQLDRENQGIAVTALFDSQTRRWTRGADMHSVRWYPTATLLGDGRLLVTSGDRALGHPIEIPEIYDPAADTWTRVRPAARTQPLYPFMFLLPDGRIFEAGPARETWFLDLAAGGHWSRGPRNRFGDREAGSSAVMYTPGKILVAGGGRPATTRAAVVDLQQPVPRWREIAPMIFPRLRFTLTILADGSVLAVGGTWRGGAWRREKPSHAILPAEIWDPHTERWTVVAPLGEARMYHSAAALLPDGKVVVGGGEHAGKHRAQLYSPPYLFRGPRPVVRSTPSGVNYGATFAVETPQVADIDRVALLRPAAVTHGFDHNQRYVPLTFERSGDTIAAVGPADGNTAPPGDYLLFVVDRRGVPSSGRWIRLGPVEGG